MSRSTFITGPRSTYYPRSALVEATRFLASTARRFERRQANVGDVELAITEWRGAVRDAEANGGIGEDGTHERSRSEKGAAK